MKLLKWKIIAQTAGNAIKVFKYHLKLASPIPPVGIPINWKGWSQLRTDSDSIVPYVLKTKPCPLAFKLRQCTGKYISKLLTPSSEATRSLECHYRDGKSSIQFCCVQTEIQCCGPSTNLSTNLQENRCNTF